MWPEQPFENYVFAFTVMHGNYYDSDKGKFFTPSADMQSSTDVDSIYYTFETTGGFSSLS